MHMTVYIARGELTCSSSVENDPLQLINPSHAPLALSHDY